MCHTRLALWPHYWQDCWSLDDHVQRRRPAVCYITSVSRLLVIMSHYWDYVLWQISFVLFDQGASNWSSLKKTCSSFGGEYREHNQDTVSCTADYGLLILSTQNWRLELCLICVLFRCSNRLASDQCAVTLNLQRAEHTRFWSGCDKVMGGSLLISDTVDHDCLQTCMCDSNTLRLLLLKAMISVVYWD